MPEGAFCTRQNNHAFGYSIQKNGTVFRLNSLGGMPNPFTQFAYVQIEEQSSFEIVEVRKNTRTIIKIIGKSRMLSPAAFTDQINKNAAFGSYSIQNLNVTPKLVYSDQNSWLNKILRMLAQVRLMGVPAPLLTASNYINDHHYSLR